MCRYCLVRFIAVRLRFARLLTGVQWTHLVGVGLLGGIGFTVSLFISDLAFADAAIVARAKLAVLIASLIAGFAGYVILRLVNVRSARSG